MQPSSVIPNLLRHPTFATNTQPPIVTTPSSLHAVRKINDLVNSCAQEQFYSFSGVDQLTENDLKMYYQHLRKFKQLTNDFTYLVGPGRRRTPDELEEIRKRGTIGEQLQCTAQERGRIMKTLKPLHATFNKTFSIEEREYVLKKLCLDIVNNDGEDLFDGLPGRPNFQKAWLKMKRSNHALTEALTEAFALQNRNALLKVGGVAFVAFSGTMAFTTSASSFVQGLAYYVIIPAIVSYAIGKLAQNQTVSAFCEGQRLERDCHRNFKVSMELTEDRSLFTVADSILMREEVSRLITDEGKDNEGGQPVTQGALNPQKTVVSQEKR